MKIAVFTPVRKVVYSLLELVGFVVLVILYSFKLLLDTLADPQKKTSFVFAGFANSFTQLYEAVSVRLDFGKSNTVSSSYLIELAFRNMQAKRTRTIVTIGGMAIGIAFIVFLVSLGYGMQDLVTSRVARLEELQQAEVLPGLSDELALNDEVLSRLSAMPNVTAAMPLISVVGRVSFQESASDLAVYGVTSDYLQSSAIQPVRGDIFDSHEIAYSMRNRSVQENEDTTEADQSQFAANQAADQAELISFTIDEGAWLRVRTGASTSDSVLGYTRRTEPIQSGNQVIGAYYSEYSGTELQNEDGENQALWIQSDFALWRNVACASSESDAQFDDPETSKVIDPDCADGQYVPLRDDVGQQVIESGYTAQISLSVVQNVLGTTSQIALVDSEVIDTQTAQISTDGTLPVVQLDTVSPSKTRENRQVVEIPDKALRQAVLNRAVLSLIGINEQDAVGQTITLTFVAVGDLIEGESDRIESVPTEYTIVGVTPEENTPVIYVPFIELRSLGITRISQIKVVADTKESLPTVRASIESMGYGTVSVADTVSQINNLFATFRLVMAVIGLVALSVATLGMFNTLTVSLLERTREVGLMKAMGMKSDEVRELFLTESMIMGFYGGILGLLLGIGMGKLVSLLLSTVSVARGVGFIDVSVVPLRFVLVVVVLSLIVGLFTGYYPAKRATKISALNALRYE